jgi:hypothetical protein
MSGLTVTLKPLDAYEIRCNSNIEPAFCGAGEFVRASLEMTTDDGRIRETREVTVSFLPPPVLANYKFPLDSALYRICGNTVESISMTIDFGDQAPGSITASAGVDREAAIASWQ